MTPKWVTPVALAAFLLGAGIIVAGPPLLYAVVEASVDAELSPDEIADEKRVAEFKEAKAKQLVESCFWLFPAGGALGFGGMIGLFLAWVSRPLGSDLDDEPPGPDSPPADGE